jgi:2-polyprenyl-3-methyl-5-hydroxy-6-metoxy-1,4-benzoquinol methylase
MSTLFFILQRIFPKKENGSRSSSVLWKRKISATLPQAFYFIHSYSESIHSLSASAIMAKKHFFEQRKHGESYLIPFFERECPKFRTFQILDVGCAEAGFLDALHAAGMAGLGLELKADRISTSKGFNPGLNIIEGDITDPDIVAIVNKTFDLIVLRDVIEHIPDKDIVFEHLSSLLRPNGFVYITFPPFLSPFGGHQQNAKTFLRRIPWLHLLPATVAQALGNAAGEHPAIVESIITQRHIGLSIRQFEELAAKHCYQIYRKELFLFRPVFRARYGLPTQKVPDVPMVRELLTLGCECLLQKAPALAP